MEPMVMKVKSLPPSSIVEAPAVASSTYRQVARRGSPGPVKSTSVTRVPKRTSTPCSTSHRCSGTIIESYWLYFVRQIPDSE
jgi:hypothetical protein